MNKHKHIFKHIGGGCLISSDKKLPCDDHYKCECGLEFRLETDRMGHRFLPEIIKEKPMSELKKEEQNQILNADILGT